MTVKRSQKSLQSRVEDLEAAIEIMNLEARYARVWDTGQAEAWADVFTEDGVFENVAGPDRPGRRVQGRAELAKFCDEVNAFATGIHLMHTPHIVVDGDTAVGGLYFEYRRVNRQAPDATAQGSTSGYYDVRYVRTERGWRMKTRVEKGIIRASSTFYEI